jgi:cell division protein FtsN
MRNRKKTLPGYVWLLSGLAVGLFVAFIVYLDKQPENPKDFGTAVEEELKKLKQAKKKVEPEKTAATEKKEQKYNFYTILPELEVLIPESETRPPEPPPETKSKARSSSSSTSSVSKPSVSKPSVSKQYVLQVGSFQNLDDAKKLKANLAFLGITANIQNVTVNRQSWHRVRTGPYKSKQQLYKNQKILKQNNIPAISMELK